MRKILLFAVLLLFCTISKASDPPFIKGTGIALTGGTSYPQPIMQVYKFRTSPYIYLGDSTLINVINNHIGVMAYTAGSGISISGRTVTNSRYYYAGTGISLSGSTFNLPLIYDIHGTASVMIGKGAGRTLSAGAGRNTGVGDSLMRGITTGTDNTGLGYGVLRADTSGSFNIGIGAYSMYRRVSGIDNIGIGYEALMTDTNGSSNIAIGTGSLYPNHGKTGNTAIGYRALYKDTLGQYNTAIGYTTDVNATGLTNSTALGYGAVITASNQIRLGNSSISSLYCQGAFTPTTTYPPNFYIDTTGQFKRSTVVYSAGAGITLTGGTYSHTAHTGDATGSGALTVVALQGQAITTTVPQGSQYLQYNVVTGWTPKTLERQMFEYKITLTDSGVGSNLNYTASTGSDSLGQMYTLPYNTVINWRINCVAKDSTQDFLGSDTTWSGRDSIQAMGVNYDFTTICDNIGNSIMGTITTTNSSTFGTSTQWTLQPYLQNNVLKIWSMVERDHWAEKGKPFKFSCIATYNSLENK